MGISSMDQVERQAEATLQKEGLASSSILYDKMKFFTKEGIEVDDNYAFQHPEGPPASAYPMMAILPVAKGQQEEEFEGEEAEQDGKGTSSATSSEQQRRRKRDMV